MAHSLLRPLLLAACLSALAIAITSSRPAHAADTLNGIVAVSAGASHTCALTVEGGVKCWGSNEYGRLGDGLTADRSAPVDVHGLSSGVQAISAGGSHTCALTTAGGVKCWGRNSSGQLGDGTLVDRHTPVDVVDLESGVLAITAGGSHTCALTTAGGVRCWGYNGAGQLGTGDRGQRRAPVRVSGLGLPMQALTAGNLHTCALSENGGALCWGSNASGQLGDGTTVDRLTPVDVSGLGSGVASISAGVDHTCARTDAGAATCWGDNRFGGLGDGTTVDRLTPSAVTGLSSGVQEIDAGGSYTCARTESGGVTCWGRNWKGQLGDGSTADRPTPADVFGLSAGVTAITTGNSHTCALIDGGAVKCWGANWTGQLGDGSTVDRSLPGDVIALNEVLYLPAVQADDLMD